MRDGYEGRRQSVNNKRRAHRFYRMRAGRRAHGRACTALHARACFVAEVCTRVAEVWQGGVI